MTDLTYHFSPARPSRRKSLLLLLTAHAPLRAVRGLSHYNLTTLLPASPCPP
jgi:hypothetical protein